MASGQDDEAPARWEQRERKLEAKRRSMAKHGRSLLTAVPAAEVKRAGGKGAKRGGRRGPRRRR
jgi:hypothetical protein